MQDQYGECVAQVDLSGAVTSSKQEVESNHFFELCTDLLHVDGEVFTLCSGWCKACARRAAEVQSSESFLSLSNTLSVCRLQFTLQQMACVYAHHHLSKTMYRNSSIHRRPELFTQLYTQQSAPVC